MRTRLVLLPVVGTLVGCATISGTPKEVAPLPAGGVYAVTEPIGVISDTQIHESRGTASRVFSKAGDEIVEVTIRTGQQVIGASDLMTHTLRSLASMPLTLHIGDAIDVSCDTEWEAFVRGLKGAGFPASKLVLAAGNHDGFMVGNGSPLESNWYNSGYWDEVCNQGRWYMPERPRRFLDKNDLIARNLKLTALVNGRVTDAPPPASGQCRLNADAPIACTDWSLNPAEPWTSFMIQIVRLPISSEGRAKGAPPVYAIVLDSSTYDNQPTISPTSPIKAGLSARFGSAQLHRVRSIITNQLPPDAKFFLVSHHHIDQWHVDGMPNAARNELKAIIEARGFLRFVLSAHTHEGAWYDHDLFGVPLIELNTGSLADPPLYYRDLQFVVAQSSRWRVRSNRHDVVPQSLPHCATYKLPESGSGYGIDDQASQNARLHQAPGFVRSIARGASAVYRFLAFWLAKHDELKPQLLAYRDVVHTSLPEDAKWGYSKSKNGTEVTLNSRAEIEARLHYLAHCTHQSRCSIQEKGNLLKQLEDDLSYGSTVFAADIVAKAEQTRVCGAVAAASAVGKGDRVVAAVLKWSAYNEVELPPNNVGGHVAGGQSERAP